MFTTAERGSLDNRFCDKSVARETKRMVRKSSRCASREIWRETGSGRDSWAPQACPSEPSEAPFNDFSF